MKVETQDLRIAAVLASAQQLPNQAPLPTKPADNKSATDPTTAASDQVFLNITVSRNTVETIQRITDIGEFLNSTAKSIRQTDQNLGIAQDITDRMKASLEKIVKNFPPFPLDSKDRQELLMSFKALQKEIVKLTIPAPPPPVYEKVKHLWQATFSYQGGKLATVDLPELAPDSHVNTALRQLDTISNQISVLREELGNSVKGEAEHGS